MFYFKKVNSKIIDKYIFSQDKHKSSFWSFSCIDPVWLTQKKDVSNTPQYS